MIIVRLVYLLVRLDDHRPTPLSLVYLLVRLVLDYFIPYLFTTPFRDYCRCKIPLNRCETMINGIDFMTWESPKIGLLNHFSGNAPNHIQTCSRTSLWQRGTWCPPIKRSFARPAKSPTTITDISSLEKWKKGSGKRTVHSDVTIISMSTPPCTTFPHYAITLTHHHIIQPLNSYSTVTFRRYTFLSTTELKIPSRTIVLQAWVSSVVSCLES